MEVQAWVGKQSKSCNRKPNSQSHLQNYSWRQVQRAWIYARRSKRAQDQVTHQAAQKSWR